LDYKESAVVLTNGGACKFFELLKVPTKYVIGAFVVTVIFLFAPDSFLTTLGVLKYRTEGKSYFGILLLLLSVLLFGAIADATKDKVLNYRSRRPPNFE
jgi:hypothetical protein